MKPSAQYAIGCAIIGVLCLWFLVMASGMFDFWYAIRLPGRIYIRPADSHAEMKYAIEAYATDDLALCDRFRRPYVVALPEMDIDSQKTRCKAVAIHLGQLVLAHETRSATACMDSFEAHSEALYSHCQEASRSPDLRTMIESYLPLLVSSNINSICGRETCDTYTESRARLAEYFLLMTKE